MKLSTCCKWNVAGNSLSSSENLPANFTYWNSVLLPFMIIYFDSSMSYSIMWIVKARATILFEKAYHFEWHKPCSDHLSYTCVTVDLISATCCVSNFGIIKCVSSMKFYKDVSLLTADISSKMTKLASIIVQAVSLKMTFTKRQVHTEIT